MEKMIEYKANDTHYEVYYDAPVDKVISLNIEKKTFEEIVEPEAMDLLIYDIATDLINKKIIIYYCDDGTKKRIQEEIWEVLQS